jgi:EmrB/QacA subfamily drug resistance transporter
MSAIDAPDAAVAAELEANAPDSARWLTLAIILISAFIVVLDNTVLNVAIPTILRDFHTSLLSVEWVITGYALTFASLLIIGGRLGDIYGHRRIFIIGCSLFAAGSLIAALSQGVRELILGEAVIEGMGASLMLPNTIAILSSTFRGRERASAFAAWGAAAGVGSAVGPTVGGFLTTNLSWRWAFGINVVVAPLAIVGALLFIRRGHRSERKVAIDLPGAGLIAVGMFLLVFALSEGSVYGWWVPIKDLSLGGSVLWPATRSVSMIPLVFLISFALLTGFFFIERWKEREARDPLFEFTHLRFRTYRYGLLTGLIVAMGQLGVSLALAVFLQNGRHLSAAQNGVWLLPMGLFVIAGAQLAGRLIRYLGATVVVRLGLLFYAIGILIIFRAITVDITVWELLPGFVFFGIGIGFAVAQLVNIVLSEIPAASSGSAGGANTTLRQVGSALGVAVIGALFTTQMIRHTTSQLNRSTLAASTKSDAIAGVHSLGANYAPGAGTSPADASIIQRAVEQGVVNGTRIALLFAFAVVALGGLFSFLIPNAKIAREAEPGRVPLVAEPSAE